MRLKKFEREILPEILQRYNGKVMVVFRDFPVHGNISITAAIAADCANEQGKFWEYHELLYEKQKEWIFNLTMLSVYAHQLGLNLSKFEACMDSRKYEEEVLKVVRYWIPHIKIVEPDYLQEKLLNGLDLYLKT